jgi:hypothetical protein
MASKAGKRTKKDEETTDKEVEKKDAEGSDGEGDDEEVEKPKKAKKPKVIHYLTRAHANIVPYHQTTKQSDDCCKISTSLALLAVC